jgi:hypothetical protein
MICQGSCISRGAGTHACPEGYGAGLGSLFHSSSTAGDGRVEEGRGARVRGFVLCSRLSFLVYAFVGLKVDTQPT